MLLNIKGALSPQAGSPIDKMPALGTCAILSDNHKQSLQSQVTSSMELFSLPGRI